ncbi:MULTISPECIES: hypothetical protein [unclassified Streptomyces]|uniref:hypothetical protein n=1 Tax=unclassified Streptomyces TaxID=2593676 RepID=UPI000DD533BD|nr:MULTISPECIES: hypothetical protein [unclassified Streptomyces]QZZ28804.1 hypothetical protein A7X85_23360 [Streptomyces sp. ST1015]
MTSPYTAPTPPAPRPPDTRPLRRRKRVWLGGAGLFLAGALIAAPANDNKQPVEAKTKPAVTVTATVTTTPAPGPTITETATPEPAPTVTVTETTTTDAKPADTTNTTQDDPGTCSIVSNSGNCYSAGQFCRKADHGETTTNASGRRITCAYNSNAWRWTYA